MATQFRCADPLQGRIGAFWCHFPEDLRYGLGTVYAHLLWRRLTGGDVIKVMNEYAHPLPDGLTEVAELGRICPEPLDARHYRQQREAIRAIVARDRGRHPVFATILNPFGQMRDRYGWPRLQAWIAADAAAVAAAMRRIAADLAVLARDCVETGGADGIFFASQGGEAGRLDDAGFEALVAGPDRIILAAAEAAGSRTILHVCGEALDLPRYRDYPAAAVNWDAAHNADAAALWPCRCRMPGLDLRGALRDGDAAAIRAAVAALPRPDAATPQLLAAACTVSSDLAFWRMRTALAAAGGRIDPRPDPLGLLAWHGLRVAARLRGGLRRRLARLRRSAR